MMTPSKVVRWTSDEDEIIRSQYPSGGIGACYELLRLNERSGNAIYGRARKLGIVGRTAKPCKLSALRSKADAPPLLSQVLSPEITALLKAQIVDEPAHPREAPELIFLLRRWHQLVSKPTDHERRIA